MTIKDAAAASGLPAKTIRYYEEIGLVTPGRNASGYRVFDPACLRRLSLIGRARRLGFSVRDCARLVSLAEDRDRTSAEVRALASAHLAQIDARIAELGALRESLAALVAACPGDARPDCAIIEGLADTGPARGGD